MNIEENKNCTIEMFSIPEGMSVEEWYMLDLSDPLMAIC